MSNFEPPKVGQVVCADVLHAVEGIQKVFPGELFTYEFVQIKTTDAKAMVERLMTEATGEPFVAEHRTAYYQGMCNICYTAIFYGVESFGVLSFVRRPSRD